MLAHGQPSRRLGWEQDLAIRGRFRAHSPSPPLTYAQQLSWICLDLPGGPNTRHQREVTHVSQAKGLVPEGLQSL